MEYTDKEAVKVLEQLTEDVRMSPEEQKIFNGLMLQVLTRCKNDIAFFCKHFVKIVHYNTDEHVDFKFNLGQKKMLDQFYDSKEKREGKAWIIASKARQAGFTTFTNALMFHHSIFYKNAFVILIAQTEASSKENLDRIRDMMEGLPWWFRNKAILWDKGNSGKHNDSALQLTFTSLITGTEQQLLVISASKKAARGKRPTALHWTEVAFCDEAYEIVKSITPAMSRRKNSIMVLESTSNGTGNFYADKIEELLDNPEGSDYDLVFHPWYTDPDRVSEPPKDMDYDEEETNLRDTFDLTDEQLSWRRKEIRNLGSELTFKQEYPSTVEESFVATDNLYFSKKCRDIVDSSITNTMAVQRLKYTSLGPESDEFGTTVVFSHPNPSYEYALAADISLGEGGDYTVISILDPFGRLACITRDQYRPDEAATVIRHLAIKYNNAKVSIERNGIGAYVINSLQNQYYYNNYFVADDGKVGFHTSETSKQHILAQLQEQIVAETVHLPYIELLTEMKVFEIADNGKPKAKKGDGNYDDVIMSLAICIENFMKYRPGIIDDETIEQPIKKRFAF